VLRKKTTKTAARGEWDLAKLPLVMSVLAHIPAERRIGPMVVRETTGLPYRANKYQREWRAVARGAGLPDSVCNRDSRAGGITEGDLAGAEETDLQRLATHADPKTTRRYIRSTTRRATDKVAALRVAGRSLERKNGGGT
jgi:integrase